MPDNVNAETPSSTQQVLSIINEIRNNPAMDQATKLGLLNELAIERVTFPGEEQARQVVGALAAAMQAETDPQVKLGELTVMGRMIERENRELQMNGTPPTLDWQTLSLTAAAASAGPDAARQVLQNNDSNNPNNPGAAPPVPAAPSLDQAPQPQAEAEAQPQAQSQSQPQIQNPATAPSRPGAPTGADQVGSSAAGDAAAALLAAETATGYSIQSSNDADNAAPGPQPGLPSTPRPTSDEQAQRERLMNRQAVDFAMGTPGQASPGQTAPYNTDAYGPINGQPATANGPVQASPGPIPVIRPGQPGPAQAQTPRPGDAQQLMQLLQGLAGPGNQNDVRDLAERLTAMIRQMPQRMPSPPPPPEPAPGSGTIAA